MKIDVNFTLFGMSIDRQHGERYSPSGPKILGLDGL
jgi:hypothetical protein